jgi:beta-mannosidase
VGSPDPTWFPVSIAARTGLVHQDLTAGWEMLTLSPGLTLDAAMAEPAWSSVDRPVANGDDFDHWFRITLPSAPAASQSARLVFDGIATIAEIYRNRSLVATSTSMFQPFTVDITESTDAATNAGGPTIVICCRSLDQYLSSLKIPRARWKTKLVVDQRLRGVRTTLLGRIPSWTPPTTVVGAWRPVRVEYELPSPATNVKVHAARNADSSMSFRLDLGLAGDSNTPDLQATLSVGTSRATFEALSATDDSTSGANPCLVATVDTTSLARWYPHTHGESPLHDVRIHGTVNGQTIDLNLGRTGIREITVDRDVDGHGFGLVVNGIAVFCRGGSLMPLDVTTLHDDPTRLRSLLMTLRRAGINMVRIPGPSVPGTRALFDLCDELGMLVWHDLPMANFDYPSTPEFIGALIEETGAWMQAAALSPSLAVICGGSEIEQQAAMTGLDAAKVNSNAVLDAVGALVAGERPDIAVVRSSPTGGHLPFSVDRGVSHYFGVGAYRRDLSDARTARVRFAAECLALANVGSQGAVAQLLGDTATAPTSPEWKSRVPRDRGTGWDFDDVRDHYARVLFGVDPFELRYADPQWYLTVARATSAEVMTRVFSEWRQANSTCRGGLVWFLNDLWAGAGWGVIDNTGEPKAALHGMAKALAPVALLTIDEGLNGLDLWICNDMPKPLHGTLEVRALRESGDILHHGSRDVAIQPHSSLQSRCDEILGHFTDPTYAYRFGPRSVHAVTARLVADDGTELASSLYVPSPTIERRSDLGVRAEAAWVSESMLAVTLSAERICRLVDVEVEGATVWPNMANIVPGQPTAATVEFGDNEHRIRALRGEVAGTITPLNAATVTTLKIPRWEAG